LTLEPLSPSVSFMATAGATFARRYDEAIEHGLKGIEVEPNHPMIRQYLGAAYLYRGCPADAIREFEKARDLWGGVTSLPLGYLANAYVAAGNREAAVEIRNDLVSRAEREPLDLYHVSVAHVALGDHDAAIAWAERTSESRGGTLSISAKVDPILDVIRLHPRFQELLRA
jgi:tetratricopeptide (TPR) repeat protein